jgi:hypothetical protein
MRQLQFCNVSDFRDVFHSRSNKNNGLEREADRGDGKRHVVHEDEI